MSQYDPSLSAIERARRAYEELMQRQRDVAQLRLARERKIRTRWLVSVGVLVGSLLGVAIYNGWIPQGLRSTILAGDQEAAKRFGATRTGQVRTTVQGNTCQELNFSNDKGSYVSGNLVACEAVVVRPTQTDATAGSRVNSIRDAFTR